MNNLETFFGVDLKSWVLCTIIKVQQGLNWNHAWLQTYIEFDGSSMESGKKGCPMNGTKTLYQLGRIKGCGKPHQNISLRDIWENYSKNGVYSILTIEYLSQDSGISLKDLWPKIQERVRQELGEEPA